MKWDELKGAERIMRLRTKGSLLAAGALFAAGFIIWPGCATPPLPAKRTPLSSLRRTDFAFENGAHPSKSEIVNRIGEPNEYFADLRVACYKLNQVSRRRLWLLFGILPIAAPKDADRIEVVMIQFDDEDRMQRHAIRTCYATNPRALRSSALAWRTESAGNSQAHLPER